MPQRSPDLDEPDKIVFKGHTYIPWIGLNGKSEAWKCIACNDMKFHPRRSKVPVEWCDR